MTVITRTIDVLVRTVAPVVLALLAGGLILALLGANPLTFYYDVLQFGLFGDGWQHSLTAMAPLLCIALGQIVAFRAQLWNLGYAGTFLLAAAVTAGLAPALFTELPFGLALTLTLVIALAVGAALGIVPALLKIRHGTNEVITSLMMSFIAIGGANLLVRGPWQDPTVSVPQTRVLELAHMLPFVPGTRVHLGIVFALIAVGVVHVLMLHTPFGLRADIMGANPAAARHLGINVRRMTVAVFVISGGLFALAAVADMLGQWGYFRAGWNPGYGDKVLPFVFLARLHPFAAVPLVGAYAVLATGGTIAAGRAGVSVDVLLLIVALVLVFMLLIEVLGTRWKLGRSYLPRGLFGGAQP